MSDPRSRTSSGHPSAKRPSTPVREDPSKFVRVRLHKQNPTLHNALHIPQHQHIHAPPQQNQTEAYARKVTSCHLSNCLRAPVNAPLVLRKALSSKIFCLNTSKKDFPPHSHQVGDNPFEVNLMDVPVGLSGYGGGAGAFGQPAVQVCL